MDNYHPTINPGFPVYVYEEGMELPKQGTYFLVSGNGLWLHKDTGIVRAFVPVNNISVLQELDAEAWVDCNLPKLPAQFTKQIKAFFQKVVEMHRSEASVTLYFNKQEQKYKIHVPQQFVSHGGVRYRRSGMTHLEGMEGYLRVGTIHSHCDFGAFHSGTDIGDEEDFDGIHCTFGHNDREEFTISASIVVNGHRLVVDPLKVLDGIAPVEAQAPSTGLFWVKRKTDQCFRLVEGEGESINQDDLTRWLSQVSAGGIRPITKFKKGDIVEWAGEMKTVSFRNNCGDGPFTVDSVEGSLVTIVTDIGLSKFSERLFKLAEPIQEAEIIDERNKED